MKIIPALDIRETESLMAGIVNIYCYLAAWHCWEYRLKFRPSCHKSVLFAGVFPSTFATLQQLTPSRRVKATTAQKPQYKSLNSHVWLYRVSHLLLVRSCWCEILGLRQAPPGRGRASSLQPRLCTQGADGGTSDREAYGMTEGTKKSWIA